VGRRRQKTEGEQTMKCGICKAEMEETTVTYTEDIDQGVIVIRHVPAHVCTECGNTWYNGTIAAQLEKMVDKFASSAGTEVSVINFEKLVA
jgi:YgiT-type zinc finger domain-containing protein